MIRGGGTPKLECFGMIDGWGGGHQNLNLYVFAFPHM